MSATPFVVLVACIVFLVCFYRVYTIAQDASTATAAIEKSFLPRIIKSYDTQLNAYASALSFNGGSITFYADDVNKPLYILPSAIQYASMALVVPRATTLQEGDEFTFWLPVTIPNTRNIRWFPIETDVGGVWEGQGVGTDDSAWGTDNVSHSSTVGKLVVVKNGSGVLSYAMFGGSLANSYK